MIKIDHPDQLYRMADNCIDRRTKDKQKQLNEKEKDRIAEKSKQKERKQKINKRVFSSDELKYFLN